MVAAIENGLNQFGQSGVGGLERRMVLTKSGILRCAQNDIAAATIEEDIAATSRPLITNFLYCGTKKMR
jgi:hypothetical protein